MFPQELERERSRASPNILKQKINKIVERSRAGHLGASVEIVNAGCMGQALRSPSTRL